MGTKKPKAPTGRPKPKAPTGRPKGATTEKRISDATPSRCAKCGSTERTGYADVRTMPFAGADSAGNPYTHVVWRRTSCKHCGQSRIDRSSENRIQGDAK